MNPTKPNILWTVLADGYDADAVATLHSPTGAVVATFEPGTEDATISHILFCLNRDVRREVDKAVAEATFVHEPMAA